MWKFWQMKRTPPHWANKHQVKTAKAKAYSLFLVNIKRGKGSAL